VGLFARPASRVLALTAWAGVLVSTAEAATAPAGALRDHLELLARQLEAAVGRVSPSAQILTGQVEPTQALRVSGVGVVFVLPSRALPLPRRPTGVRARLREQREREEQQEAASQPARPPRVGTVTIVPTPEPPALRKPVPAPGTPDLAQLERQLEREMAVRSQLMRELLRASVADDPLLQRALELQMLAVHEQADLFRRQVERVRAANQQVVIEQLSQGAHPRAQVSPEAVVLGGPSQEAPWNAWLETVPPETSQASQELVRQVQDAIVAGLEAYGGVLSDLDPQEGVTVAVEFVASGTMGRTRVRCRLVLRVPAGAVVARAKGSLSAAEFRERVLARQY
jgi:hypothetical protein